MGYLLVVISYLLGSIPFGLLLGKWRGIEVRSGGSGNIGATNVGRLLGRKAGALTLLLDAGKAVVPMLAAAWWFRAEPEAEPWVILCGAAAFLGHLFPVYLKFQGGKGVATALGIFLYLEPWAALLDLVLFVGIVYNWGYVSLGSLSGALLLPGLVWLLSGSWPHTALAFLVAALIWFKHRDNVKRLLRGEEQSWRKAE